MRLSIAARLALMFAVAALAGFALIGVALHLVLGAELERHQRDQVAARLEDMRYMLNHAHAPGIATRARAKIEALTAADGHTRFWMWSEDADFRYGADLDAVVAATRPTRGLVDLTLAGRRMRVLGVDLPANPMRPPVRLMVGVDAQPFIITLHSFDTELAWLMIAGALGVAGSGYWIARRGLRPVQRLSRDAQRIGPDNRALRLQLPALAPELADLGGSFNAALDRLDAAFQQLQTFNDDVAHELRTPLANLIGQTQVALSRERGAAQLREVLQSNLEELERMRAMVADMLFLARAEQGGQARRPVAAAIADEVAKTVEFFEVLLDEAGVGVDVSGDATAPIETALFRRALTNLLHNAVQHAPRGARITVRIAQRADHAEVAVSNPSATISAEHLERLFDRFYRVDSARANSGDSHGLGLSIVKAIATMHQGQVFARSVDGLTTVGFSVALAQPLLPR